MVSQQLLLELKKIIEEDYGIKLTLAEVMEVATTLVQFAEVAMKIEAKPTALKKLCSTNENEDVKTTTHRQSVPPNLEKPYFQESSFGASNSRPMAYLYCSGSLHEQKGRMLPVSE
ncbi:MAG: hypothetical protein H6774_01090 [Pseudomonadales bacterium]|nr:hypothetical protein [Pseudomonadales bacterium]